MNGRQLVAWNLRRLRVLRGLSQEKLAFDAGIDRAYLGGLEREQENPTVDLLDRVAASLGVSVEALFEVPDRNAPKPKSLPRGRKAAS
jgi:transcriptional regulator with XRE-family HTH domain